MTEAGPGALATVIRRSRILVGSSAVCAAALGFGAAKVPQTADRFGAFLVVLGLSIGLAISHQVLFRRLSWRARHPPAAFLPGRRNGQPAFLVARPQAPWGGALIVLGLLFGSRLGRSGADLENLLVGFLVVAARPVWSVFGRSHLALGVDGVWIGAFRPRLIPWETIWPARAALQERPDRTLRIPVIPPAEVVPVKPDEAEGGVSSQTWSRLSREGLDYNVNALVAVDSPPAAADALPVPPGPDWIDLDPRAMVVNASFLAHALGYYQAHPAARAAIGTQAEQARLIAEDAPG